MGVHVLWESQLEYHICHNDWEEVSKLLEFIPASVLSEGSLQIALDVLQPATVGCNSELPDFGNYICSIEDLDAVCLDVPKIKVFRFSANGICSTWLRMLMEQELAKKLVFLKEYWEGTGEIVSLLARSGFIMNRNKMSPEDDSIESFSDLNLSNIGRSTVDTLHPLHKLLVHHCAEHNLPNLLDLYLDHHKLVQDNDLLCSLQEAAVSVFSLNYHLLCWIYSDYFYQSQFCIQMFIGCKLFIIKSSSLRFTLVDEINYFYLQIFFFSRKSSPYISDSRHRK